MPRVVCDDPAARPLIGPARRLFGLAIDLNRADASTLESLPGIGPSRAESIVAGRPYREVAELRRVPGIGRALLARIRPFVTAGAGSGFRKPEQQRTDSLKTTTRR